MNAVYAEYDRLCNTPSDINFHLPKLKEITEQCESVAEIGVRAVVSSYAFLAGKPKKLNCYDIGRWERVDQLEVDAKRAGIELNFKQASILDIDIEEVDFIFIDTYHVAGQLAEELRLHADKAKKFIGFHDTTTFWERGEDPYEGLDEKGRVDGRGLRYAIEPFLAAHPEWRQLYRTEENNGLLILERVK